MKKIAFVLSAAGLMSACGGEPPIDNAVAVDCTTPQGLLSRPKSDQTVDYGKPIGNEEETAAVCPDEAFYDSHEGNAQ